MALKIHTTSELFNNTPCRHIRLERERKGGGVRRMVEPRALLAVGLGEKERGIEEQRGRKGESA
jgi:hypothetical protein